MKLRNIAIIAHVDHGKTTIVDWLLKQSKTFRENEAFMTADLIMDSNDQERERGITILAKNTAIHFKDYKINIIDTPGHADFGGEVERTLNMADGALLMVDAQEGPMPQTKFVLKKALELGLKIIVVINKIDKKDADVDTTLRKIHDLFLDLVTDETQLDFPVYYAIGREGKAWDKIPHNANEPADLTTLFDAIIKYVPEPEIILDKPFQMLVTTLDWDNFKGKYAVGRIKSGKVKPGQQVVLINHENEKTTCTIDKVFTYQGLKRIETEEGQSGDIIALTGIKNAGIGDTLTDPQNPVALPTIKIEEPTLKMSVGPNTSPLFGKEGKFFTSRQVLDRIHKELQTNVSMKMAVGEDGSFVISGRGELHLSVFLETMRREGFELEVGKPHVITKIVDKKELEPVEEITIDVDNVYVGAVTGELGRRRGVLISQLQNQTGDVRLVFKITTRGILGLRGQLMTLSKGTAVVSSSFLGYEEVAGNIQKLRKGVLIASESGTATGYGLATAQDKGPAFIAPGGTVYGGMIVGINARDEDLEINVTREKKLSNVRSVGETAVILTPPVILSLEQCLGFLEDDELLEITPKNLRLRKKILNHTLRYRSQK